MKTKLTLISQNSRSLTLELQLLELSPQLDGQRLRPRELKIQ